MHVCVCAIQVPTSVVFVKIDLIRFLTLEIAKLHQFGFWFFGFLVFCYYVLTKLSSIQWCLRLFISLLRQILPTVDSSALVKAISQTLQLFFFQIYCALRFFFVLGFTTVAFYFDVC